MPRAATACLTRPPHVKRVATTPRTQRLTLMQPPPPPPEPGPHARGPAARRLACKYSQGRSLSLWCFSQGRSQAPPWALVLLAGASAASDGCTKPPRCDDLSEAPSAAAGVSAIPSARGFRNRCASKPGPGATPPAPAPPRRRPPGLCPPFCALIPLHPPPSPPPPAHRVAASDVSEGQRSVCAWTPFRPPPPQS